MPAWGHRLDDGEFAEILVQRDQGPPLGMCMGEHGVVARIVWPAATPIDVVPGFLQHRLQAARDTGVEQELQAGSCKINGSTCSCPTRRWA